MNRKSAVLAASPFWFRECGRIYISILRAWRSIPMKLLQLSKRQHLLTSFVILLPSAALEEEEDLLLMSDAVASTKLLEEKKQAMIVLSEAMN